MSSFDASRIALFAGESFAASSLLMALAWLAPFRKTASLRHLIWAAAFGALIFLPVLAAFVPGSIVFSLAAPPVAVPMALSAAALAPAPAPAGVQFDITDAASLLIAVWLGGVCLIALRSVFAAFVLRSLRRASTEHPFDDSELPELANGRGYELRIANAEHGPVTWGIFRPVILLPYKAQFWPCERLQAVLLHELAHIHRRDSLTQMLSLAACALYWPNPLVWLGARALRREAEMAADDAVIVSGMAASEYAGELLHVAAEFRARDLSPAMPLFMAAPSALAARVQSVLAPTQQRSGVTSMDVLKMAGIALLATTAIVAARPSLAQDMPQTPAAPPVLAAPPTPPDAADMPVPPAPPAAIDNADTQVRVVKLHGLQKLSEQDIKRMRIVIVRDKDEARKVMATVQPQIEQAMAQVRDAHIQMHAVQDMRPQIDAALAKVGPEIDKALADARAQLATISDEKVRARVDAALARAQAKIHAAQAHAADSHHQMVFEVTDDNDNDKDAQEPDDAK